MKAKCINGFSVEMYDGDGFSIDDDYFIVKKDSVWDIEEDGFRIINGEIRLTSDEYGWLEITKNHFETDFEIID